MCNCDIIKLILLILFNKRLDFLLDVTNLPIKTNCQILNLFLLISKRSLVISIACQNQKYALLCKIDTVSNEIYTPQDEVGQVFNLFVITRQRLDN